MKIARKSLIGLVALGSALVMPMAFAQSETAPTATQDPAAQSAAPTGQTAAPTDQSTAPADQTAAPGADAKKVTWADLDADKDGTLSKSEAAPLASLSQVFDEADSDANGKLTADEYKAYVAKNNGAATDSQG
jgi:hypothetical protein